MRKSYKRLFIVFFFIKWKSFLNPIKLTKFYDFLGAAIYSVFKDSFYVKDESLMLKCYYVDEGYKKIVADTLYYVTSFKPIPKERHSSNIIKATTFLMFEHTPAYFRVEHIVG